LKKTTSGDERASELESQEKATMSKKFETHVTVVEGFDVTQIKPQRAPTTEDPRDAWGFIEEVIRNTKPVSGKVTTIAVPIEMICGTDWLTELNSALQSGEFPVKVEVVAVHGRCVEARSVNGLMPSWPQLASVLLECGGPCDDFRIVNGRLFASLKTAQQQLADKCARGLDEMFRAQLPHFGSKWDFNGLYRLAEEAANGAAAAPAKAASRRKAKIPEGVAQFVMRVIEKDWPTDAVDIEELIDAVTEITPPKIDGAGKNRTMRYIREAIDKLIARDVLYLHDKTQVSLHEE
jgi:uncharacterized protein (DUF2267 family)